MRNRTISSVLGIALVAATWWVLPQDDAVPPESSEVAVNDDEAVHMSALLSEDPPYAGALEPSPVEPTSTSPAVLARQRERLRSTAAQLRARRDEALASHTPQPTLRMLEGHIARVERRLAALELPAD